MVGDRLNSPAMQRTIASPGWWRATSQVLACAILMTASGMVVTTYGVVARPFAQEWHPPRSLLMLSLTIMAAFAAIGAPFGGGLMDRRSIRRLAGLGVGLLAFGFLALSFATSMAGVFLIYGLLMAPSSVLAGPLMATVLLSRWFGAGRGRAIGLAVCGVAVGGLVFPPVIQALYAALGWREGLRVLALVILAIAGPAVAIIADRPEVADDELRTAAATPAGAPPEPAVRPGTILRQPAFWQAAFVFAVVLSGMQGMVTSVTALALDHGVAAADAALLVSVYAGSGLAAKLCFAFLADRVAAPRLIVSGLIGYGLGMLCLVHLFAGYPQLAVAAGLVGGFGGIMVPMQVYAVSFMFDPRLVGRAAGLLHLVVLIALLVSPPLFGLSFDLAGGYAPVFSAYAALAAAGVLVASRLRIGRGSPAAVA